MPKDFIVLFNEGQFKVSILSPAKVLVGHDNLSKHREAAING
jgi:hypothetical protein